MDVNPKNPEVLQPPVIAGLDQNYDQNDHNNSKSVNFDTNIIDSSAGTAVADNDCMAEVLLDVTVEGDNDVLERRHLVRTKTATITYGFEKVASAPKLQKSIRIIISSPPKAKKY